MEKDWPKSEDGTFRKDKFAFARLVLTLNLLRLVSLLINKNIIIQCWNESFKVWAHLPECAESMIWCVPLLLIVRWSIDSSGGGDRIARVSRLTRGAKSVVGTPRGVREVPQPSAATRDLWHRAALSRETSLRVGRPPPPVRPLRARRQVDGSLAAMGREAGQPAYGRLPPAARRATARQDNPLRAGNAPTVGRLLCTDGRPGRGCRRLVVAHDSDMTLILQDTTRALIP